MTEPLIKFYFFMVISEKIKKIHDLSLTKRKIIFWVIIIIFGLTILTFWIISVKRRIEFAREGKMWQELKLPNLKEGLEKLPKFDTTGPIEELKKDAEMITESAIEESNKTQE